MQPRTSSRVGPGAFGLALTVIAVASADGQIQPQTPVFRVATDLVTTAVLVRDAAGRSVPDLRMSEFEVYEDGVRQEITTFAVSVGGRLMSDVGTARQPAAGGLILPPTARPSDASGRLIVVFIDDLHLQPPDTPAVRRVLGLVRDILVHDGDLVTLVSTGFSSVAVNPTYDYGRTRFNESIRKVMGGGMTPNEIIQASQTSQGPAGLRHHASVAFSTAYDMLEQLSSIPNRRKVFVYVSSGYDFNPFADARYAAAQARYGSPGSGAGGAPPNVNPFTTGGQQFASADLVSQLAELTRAANRANVTFYPIDPTGLSAGPGIITNITMAAWQAFRTESLSSLRVLASETGGICACDSNDIPAYLRRIDNDTSDFYLLGYVSSNPDPLRVRRRIEVRLTRPDLPKPVYREEYSIKGR